MNQGLDQEPKTEAVCTAQLSTGFFAFLGLTAMGGVIALLAAYIRRKK